MMTTELEPYLQKQVDAGLAGTDILHGALKNMMLDAEKQLYLAEQIEDESGEAMDSMERKYWEGVLDSLTDVYTLTYNLSFAINDRRVKNGNV
jgi:hypothetical protein